MFSAIFIDIQLFHFLTRIILVIRKKKQCYLSIE